MFFKICIDGFAKLMRAFKTEVRGGPLREDFLLENRGPALLAQTELLIDNLLRLRLLELFLF